MPSAMDFFRGLAGSYSNDPPPSVLAEWNKYNAVPNDIESQTGPAKASSSSAQPSLYTSLTESVMAVTGGKSTGWEASTSSVPSFRIPSGTDFVYFAAFSGAGFIFFFLAFFLFLPMLILAPAKFALSFTFGSLCTMAAFNMLSGWQASLKHMVSTERLPFSAAYIGSMMATVYAALVMKSYIFSLVFCGAQIVALLYFVLSYFPGGASGVQFFLGLLYNAVLGCFSGFTRSTGR